jgi:hypothetical protein
MVFLQYNIYVQVNNAQEKVAGTSRCMNGQIIMIL